MSSEWGGSSLRVIGLILLLAASLAALSFAWDYATGQLPKRPAVLRTISISEAEKRQKILWIDARPAGENEDFLARDALPLTEVDWNSFLPVVLDAWNYDTAVVVFCDAEGCNASKGVAKRLMAETGWENVFVLVP